MLENFISFVIQVLDWVQPVWMLLGALAVAALILGIGFIMTIIRGRSFQNRKTCVHAVRSRARRNVIFFLAFLFVIISTLAIFYLYYPAGGFVPYLAIPLLVLLWAFLCEAMFEVMDNRNRKRAGLEVCYCVCSSDCTVDIDAVKERASKKAVAKKSEKEEKEEKDEKEERKPVSKKQSAEDVKREEISEHLKRAQEREREREELGAWREEIKSSTQSDEEELRRQRFEEERKNLSILARQAKAAQFGSESPSIYDKAAQRTISKPAPIAPTTASKPAPKSAEVERTVEVETKPVETKPVETVIEKTTTRTSSDAKFNSLQAKLDVLKKDTATAAAKTETGGKYKEGEVKSALDDLLKQMRAKRGEE